MRGRALTEREIRSYRHLPETLARRVRVHSMPRIPGRYVGLCLGRHVFCAIEVSTDGESSLLAHELVHVRQWHDQGRVGLATSYLGAFLRGLWRTRSWHVAYREIPAEREARETATRWARGRQ